jgi:hypothetical protein
MHKSSIFQHYENEKKIIILLNLSMIRKPQEIQLEKPIGLYTPDKASTPYDSEE